MGRAFVTSPHELAANAEAAVDSGAYDKGLALALEGLAANPDHPGLLRQAGRASLELGGDDAVAHLRRLTELAPTDAGAWLDLGLALAAAGDVRPAADAFARASALDPDDGSTLLHFAHAAHAAGRTDEGIEALERANARTQSPAALRTLLQLCRASGRLPQAIDAAERLLTAEPGDLPTLLTLAEVQLGLGLFEAARTTYSRLRLLDIDEGHEIFACHGQVEALLRAQRWRDALDVAIDATRLDRHHLTTDLLAYATARLFGSGDRSAPDWEELEAILRAERGIHRRMHEEQVAGG